MLGSVPSKAVLERKVGPVDGEEALAALAHIVGGQVAHTIGTELRAMRRPRSASQ